MTADRHALRFRRLSFTASGHPSLSFVKCGIELDFSRWRGFPGPGAGSSRSVIASSVLAVGAVVPCRGLLPDR